MAVAAVLRNPKPNSDRFCTMALSMNNSMNDSTNDSTLRSTRDATRDATDGTVDTTVERIAYPNGKVYVGQVQNGKPHGNGKMTYANGNIYEGGWRDGKVHGVGKEMNSKGAIIHKGLYYKGKRLLHYAYQDTGLQNHIRISSERSTQSLQS